MLFENLQRFIFANREKNPSWVKNIYVVDGVIVASESDDYINSIQAFFFETFFQSIDDAIKEASGDSSNSKDEAAAEMRKLQREYDSLLRRKDEYESAKKRKLDDIKALNLKIKSLRFKDVIPDQRLITTLEKSNSALEPLIESKVELIEFLNEYISAFKDGEVLDFPRELAGSLERLGVTPKNAVAKLGVVEKMLDTSNAQKMKNDKEIAKLKFQIGPVEAENKLKEDSISELENLNFELVELENDNKGVYTYIDNYPTKIETLKNSMSYYNGNEEILRQIKKVIKDESKQSNNLLKAMIIKAINVPTGGAFLGRNSDFSEAGRSFFLDYFFNRIIKFNWRKFNFAEWTDNPMRRFLGSIKFMVENIAKDSMTAYKKYQKTFLQLQNNDESRDDDPLDNMSYNDEFTDGEKITNKSNPMKETDDKALWRDIQSKLKSSVVVEELIDNALMAFRGKISCGGQKGSTTIGACPMSSYAGWVPASTNRKDGGEYISDSNTRSLWKDLFSKVTSYVDGQIISGGSSDSKLAGAIKRFLQGEDDRDKQARLVIAVLGNKISDLLLESVDSEEEDELKSVKQQGGSLNKPINEVIQSVESKYQHIREKLLKYHFETEDIINGRKTASVSQFIDPIEMIRLVMKFKNANARRADFPTDAMDKKTDFLLGLQSPGQLDNVGLYNNTTFQENLSDTMPIQQTLTDRSQRIDASIRRGRFAS